VGARQLLQQSISGSNDWRQLRCASTIAVDNQFYSSIAKENRMIAFRLDSHSGLPAYLQLTQQVKNALRLGMIDVGDRLPTVKEVVATLAINQNTVLKAYRELEHEGLVETRQGQGTFVVRSLAGPSLQSHAALRRSLMRWVNEARTAGLDQESMQALIQDVLQRAAHEGVA
jgi:GntR family transcriptional regulator